MEIEMKFIPIKNIMNIDFEINKRCLLKKLMYIIHLGTSFSFYF